MANPSVKVCSCGREYAFVPDEARAGEWEFEYWNCQCGSTLCFKSQTRLLIEAMQREGQPKGSAAIEALIVFAVILFYAVLSQINLLCEGMR